jgi:hypothetical protein
MASSDRDPIQPILASFRKRQSQRDLDLFDHTDLKELKDTIKRIETEQASRKGLRNLNRIKPFLKALEQYAGVLDVFIQVKPDVLALIWVSQYQHIGSIGPRKKMT